MKKDKKEDYIEPSEKEIKNDEINIDITKHLDSLNELSNAMTKLSKPLIEIQKSYIPVVLQGYSRIGETVTKFARSFIDTIDFEGIIKIAVSSSLQKILSEFANALSSLHIGGASDYDSEILKRHFWVMPYEYDFNDVVKIAHLTKKQFNNEMIIYFNKSRVTRLFNECIKMEEKKDKKVLLRQIKKNYFSKNYAVCVTSLITYLDSLTLYFIDDTSKFQHLSYRVVESLHHYYGEEAPFSDDVFDLYLKLEILKNFYDILYDNDENLKNAKTNIINRNINSHGAKYLNKQIDVLRLINAIWFIQTIVNDSNMKDKFISFKDSNDKNRIKFKKKEEITS